MTLQLLLPVKLFCITVKKSEAFLYSICNDLMHEAANGLLNDIISFIETRVTV